MDRREFVRALGLAAAGLGGCLNADADAIPHPTPPSSTPTPEPDKWVDALGSDIGAAGVAAGADGAVTATVPVENTAASSRAATLVVVAEVDGQRYTADRAITVPGGATREYTVTFDASWETATAAGDVRVRRIYLYNPEYRTPQPS